MSKLLLIIDSEDLNDDCLNCPVKYAYVGGVGCSIAHKDVETEFIPDWCPLCPLPENRNTTSLIETKHEAEENHVTPQHQAGFNLGWNACLNAITGGDYEQSIDN